jgi:MYXO-CTERM domain-containing protein
MTRLQNSVPLAALILLALAEALATAQTNYTWTGANSQPGIINDPIDWSNPFNWAGSAIPSSAAGTVINFASAPAGLSVNSIGNPFTLSGLTFNTGLTVAGNPLTFVPYSPPGYAYIFSTGTMAGAVTIQNAISIGSTYPLELLATNSGPVTLSGPISTISGGGLFLDSNNTYILSNAANSYSSTDILGSTLQVTTAGALPAGRPITVETGTLDLAGTNQSIGALVLSSNFAGSGSPRPIVKNGSLTLGGDITYSPQSGAVSPSALISANLNLGWATRTIYVQAVSGDAYDVVLTGQISGTGGLTQAGSALGYLALTAANTYSGPTTVTSGVLWLCTANAVPASSAVTVSAGAFLKASPSATTAEVTIGNYSQSFDSLSGGGSVGLLNGTLTIGNDNTSPAFSGTLSLSGSTLVKVGSGTQTLSGGANSQAATVVNGGVLAVTTDAALGPAASPVTVNALGTLAYSGSATATGRAFTLNSGALSVTSGQTATLNNCTIAGGFLRGTGTFALTGGTILSGASTFNSSVVSVTGQATFVDFSNGGALTVAAGVLQPATFNGFINQGSGAITVTTGPSGTGTISATDFQTYGTLTLSPGSTNVPTQLTNAGASPLYFNGGSRTFISIPANAGQFDAGIDLHGQNAVVAGGLLVNNGFVVDSMGSHVVIADFGSLVKGAGFYQNSVQTVNGGKFQSGNSPGKATFGSFTFGPGGVNNYLFAIDDATGAAGPSPDANGQVSGWGLVSAVQRPIGSVTTPGDFQWTADAAHPLTVHLDTLINPTTVGTDVAGPMADFDPTKPYSWPAVQWTGNYSGPADAAALNSATAFDTTGFQNPIAGTLGWSLDTGGHSLSLTYTPSAVPEPGMFGLVAAGLLAVWRRRSRGCRRTVLAALV